MTNEINLDVNDVVTSGKKKFLEFIDATFGSHADHEITKANIILTGKSLSCLAVNDILVVKYLRLITELSILPNLEEIIFVIKGKKYDHIIEDYIARFLDTKFEKVEKITFAGDHDIMKHEEILCRVFIPGSFPMLKILCLKNITHGIEDFFNGIAVINELVLHHETCRLMEINFGDIPLLENSYSIPMSRLITESKKILLFLKLQPNLRKIALPRQFEKHNKLFLEASSICFSVDGGIISICPSTSAVPAVPICISEQSIRSNCKSHASTIVGINVDALVRCTQKEFIKFINDTFKSGTADKITEAIIKLKDEDLINLNLNLNIRYLLLTTSLSMLPNLAEISFVMDGKNMFWHTTCITRLLGARFEKVKKITFVGEIPVFDTARIFNQIFNPNSFPSLENLSFKKSMSCFEFYHFINFIGIFSEHGGNHKLKNINFGEINFRNDSEDFIKCYDQLKKIKSFLEQQPQLKVVSLPTPRPTTIKQYGKDDRRIMLFGEILGICFERLSASTSPVFDKVCGFDFKLGDPNIEAEISQQMEILFENINAFLCYVTKLDCLNQQLIYDLAKELIRYQRMLEALQCFTHLITKGTAEWKNRAIHDLVLLAREKKITNNPDNIFKLIPVLEIGATVTNEIQNNLIRMLESMLRLAYVDRAKFRTSNGKVTTINGGYQRLPSIGPKTAEEMAEKKEITTYTHFLSANTRKLPPRRCPAL